MSMAMLRVQWDWKTIAMRTGLKLAQWDWKAVATCVVGLQLPWAMLPHLVEPHLMAFLDVEWLTMI